MAEFMAAYPDLKVELTLNDRFAGGRRRADQLLAALSRPSSARTCIIIGCTAPTHFEASAVSQSGRRSIASAAISVAL
jgi:hypothetical protein